MQYRYLSFGGIGGLIGHEITHGFDVKRRSLNENGDQRSWNSSEADEEYKKRAACFPTQYSSYNLSETDKKVSAFQLYINRESWTMLIDLP